MPTTLQDTRTPGWFWMENTVIDVYAPCIGAAGVAVYAYLARRADRQGLCFPSYDTIARDLGLSRRTAIAYVKLLQEHGLIMMLPRIAAGMKRSANAYRLVNLRDGRSSPRTAPRQGSQPSDTKAGAAPGVEASDSATVAPGQNLHHATHDADESDGAKPAPSQILHPSTSASQQPGSATVAPGQILHHARPEAGQNGGATVAPVQNLHQGGAAVSPGMVQQMHQGGATVAPEGNTLKETQEKETQKKEKKNGALSTRDAGLGTGVSLTSSPLQAPAVESAQAEAEVSVPCQPEQTRSDEAAMLAALCQVTGKDAGLMRSSKRQEYEQAAVRLQEREFTPDDVRDFTLYWQLAHPIGSKKPNAGYPHLVQVLEDLAGALPWIQEQRRRREEAEAWQEEVHDLPPVRPQAPEVDPEVRSLWERIRDELTLRLPSAPVAADLQRARPLSLADGTLLVELPSAGMAEWWQLRLQRPVTEVVARVVDHPLTVAFTGPQLN